MDIYFAGSNNSTIEVAKYLFVVNRLFSFMFIQNFKYRR